MLVLIAGKVPDRLVLDLLNGRALDVGLDLALDVGGNKLGNVGSIDSLLERVLGLKSEVLNNESGPGRRVEVERLGVVDELDAVDEDPRELRLVLLGDGFERLEKRLVRGLVGGIGEDVSDGLASLGVGSKVLGVDLSEGGDRVLLDPETERLGGQTLVEVSGEREEGLVERLVEDDLILVDRLGGEERLGIGVAEEERVTGRGGVFGEGVGGGSRGSVRDNDAAGGKYLDHSQRSAWPQRSAG